MKICLINNLFEPYEAGGAEAVVKTIASGLKSAGFEPVIITLRPFFSGLSVENSSGLKIYRLRSMFFLWKKLPKFCRLFFHILGFFNIFAGLRIIRIIHREKIGAVITNNMTGFGIISLYLIPRKCVHAHMLHDIQLLHPSGLMIKGEENKIDGFFAELYRFAAKAATSDIRKIISPSKWLLQEHARRGFFSRSEFLVSPNPVKRLDKPLAKERAGVLNILYAGHISREKGASVLIEAFREISAEFPEAKLVMAGRVLDRKIAESASGLNIKIAGFLSNEEIKDLMRSSSVLVMPSICYENSPTVIYEAAAAGLPVITSDIGGASELALIFGGTVFPPGNNRALAELLRRELKNPRVVARKISVPEDMLVSNYVSRLEKFLF